MKKPLRELRIINCKLRMMQKIVIFISLFLFTTKIFACDCGERELNEIDNSSYKYSDLIIIGDVIKTGEHYKIKVIEILKGNVVGKTIKGTISDDKGFTNSCFDIPRNKERYIFYLKEIIKDKKLYSYSSCSGSRPLNMSIYPISLKTKKNKHELIIETNNWIDSLRKNRDHIKVFNN